MKTIPKAEIINRLNKIYDLIPSFDCKHCQKCSAPIMWFKPEEININRFLKKHDLKYMMWTDEEFKDHQMKCPYLRNNRCTIYSVRPIVCRLQGTIDELQCPYNPTVLLTHFQYKKIMKELIDLTIATEGIGEYFGTRRGINSNFYMNQKKLVKNTYILK